MFIPAYVDKDIAALPEGLDTVVGSRGYRFSGGDQQRLSLARTLLRRPRVLILDEATSALDNETERAIQDVVLGADATRLVERGTHAELLASDGAYATLLRAADEAN
ncbi:hypothetical protein AZH44_00795 [Corynebacterium striatum]|nr:hypothetical protein AZH44_00795 [Corynebacterium striatum]PXY03912.1 ABC transporter [Corynebacterium striatum]PXY13697.1 ABC transporter [Corynebacterium striatum]PXY15768.1 ABC transporter [Corynebacterium striatum]